MPTGEGQDPVQFNRDLDSLLSTTLLTRDLIADFDEAFRYDAATSHSWLVAKLRILRDRLELGDEFRIEGSQLVLRRDSFVAWVRARFPGVEDDLS